MAQKKTGDAAVRDGAKIHYTVHGDDQSGKPRIALVHSLGMNGSVWDGVVEQFGDRVQALTYDCRGHGASTKSPGPYTLETFANDLADLMTHVGWSSAHIAGGSLGGSVSLQFAVSYPQRTQTLGLIDTTSWYGAEGPKNWEGRAQDAEQKGLAPLVPFQQTRWFSDNFRAEHADRVDHCTSIFLANDPKCFAATCRMLGSFNLSSKMGQVRVPTAVIVGEEDYATPVEMAKQLEGGIPGATLQIIQKARHLTFVERPDVIAKALSELMQRSMATA
jgi:3-oxoadipate enol-lactonase